MAEQFQHGDPAGVPKW